MIKEVKQNARNKIKKNFRYLIIPSTILMIFDAIAYIFINVIITKIYWHHFDILLQLIFLLCFMLLEFVCIPLSRVLLFKTIFNLDNTSKENTIFPIKQMLSSNTIVKTVLVNFLPILLRILVQTCATKIFYFNHNYKWVAIIASWVGIFVFYKFNAVNYYIAIESEHPIKCSFRLMKNIFGKYLLLGLSFIGYVMLAASIGVLLQYVFFGNFAKNLYVPQLRVFDSFGYGVGFYLTPYIYVSDYYFFNNLKDNLK
ncbi:MAG: hypothetical protein MJ076_01710 [Clostridia bacterium]|nr:hypothetical protein [Clostridia bacterium]